LLESQDLEETEKDSLTNHRT